MLGSFESILGTGEGGGLFDLGSSSIEGLIGGFASKGGPTQSAAGDLANDSLSAMSGMFGGTSEWGNIGMIGQNAIQGLINGIRDIFYDGNQPVGFTMTITIEDFVGDIRIENATTNDHMIIRSERIEKLTRYGCIPSGNTRWNWFIRCCSRSDYTRVQ